MHLDLFEVALSPQETGQRLRSVWSVSRSNGQFVTDLGLARGRGLVSLFLPLAPPITPVGFVANTGSSLNLVSE